MRSARSVLSASVKPVRFGVGLLGLSVVLLTISLAAGSMGWAWSDVVSRDAVVSQIVWDIRAPRGLGAWLAGALLGMSGAVAQGLFRNPLADPYLLGSSAGAALGVAAFLVFVAGAGPGAATWLFNLGMTGAAFIGAATAVLLTLTLSLGVQHTLRLLLAGVVVGMVLGAFASLTMLMVPDIMRTMLAFMLGSTAFLSWGGVAVMAPVLGLCGVVAWGAARALDAISLGDATARSLGVSLSQVRMVLVGVLALATGAAVAQAGLIAFVGLVAPHLVRTRVQATHGPVLWLSALSGGVLLLAADILARLAIAPQELPVGVLTAVLGGVYLLWRMPRS